DAEDRAARELAQQRVRLEPPVLEQAAQRPERELRVVGRQPDGAAARAVVRQVVADLAAVRLAARAWVLAFPGGAQRIADREPEQHALDAGAQPPRSEARR